MTPILNVIEATKNLKLHSYLKNLIKQIENMDINTYIGTGAAKWYNDYINISYR